MWGTSVSPIHWEAKAAELQVQPQPGQCSDLARLCKVTNRRRCKCHSVARPRAQSPAPPHTCTRTIQACICSSVVECALSMGKALGSILSTKAPGTDNKEPFRNLIQYLHKPAANVILGSKTVKSGTTIRSRTNQGNFHYLSNLNHTGCLKKYSKAIFKKKVS